MFNRERAQITARDAVRRAGLAPDEAGRHQVVLEYLYHCAEVGAREGFEFSSAMIGYYSRAASSLNGLSDLVKITRAHRDDPKLSPLLDHTIAALFPSLAKK